jgi:hypothetical protein
MILSVQISRNDFTPIEKKSFSLFPQRSEFPAMEWLEKVHKTRLEVLLLAGKINPQCLNCWTFFLSVVDGGDGNCVYTCVCKRECELAYNKEWCTKAASSSAVVVCVLLKSFSEANFHAFLWGWHRTTLNVMMIFLFEFFFFTFCSQQSSFFFILAMNILL